MLGWFMGGVDFTGIYKLWAFNLQYILNPTFQTKMLKYWTGVRMTGMFLALNLYGQELLHRPLSVRASVCTSQGLMTTAIPSMIFKIAANFRHRCAILISHPPPRLLLYGPCGMAGTITLRSVLYGRDHYITVCAVWQGPLHYGLCCMPGTITVCAVWQGPLRSVLYGRDHYITICAVWQGPLRSVLYGRDHYGLCCMAGTITVCAVWQEPLRSVLYARNH